MYFRSMRTVALATIALLALLLAGCDHMEHQHGEVEQSQDGFPELTGPYLGQEPPGMEPVLFAPGIISTGMSERDVAMMPDGSEFYFCCSEGQFRVATILYTKLVDGVWTEPEVVPFASEYMDFEPCINHDGSKLFFLSSRPLEAGGEEGNQDIWAVDREGDGWGEPYNLGEPVCTDAPEFFPSVTRDGTLYFTRQTPEGGNQIWRSRLVDGQYQEAEVLPEQVNCGRAHYNSFIAPDESYIIVPVFGAADSLGGTDYYIVFRSEDDTWSEPINMGEKINCERGNEWSPYVSPDGKYFFFMSSRSRFDSADEQKPRTFAGLQELHNQPMNGNSDIWWVDARIIDQLRPQ